METLGAELLPSTGLVGEPIPVEVLDFSFAGALSSSAALEGDVKTGLRQQP